MKSFWKYLGVAFSAFVGGATTWGAAQLGQHVPSTSAQWQQFGVGIVVTGVVAMVHLLQQPPQNTTHEEVVP